mgnify:CR=1 FL=1
MENNLLVLEQIAMELVSNSNHRFFERGFYNFSVKTEKENNPNNITIKFFGSKFANEYEYGYSNKFHHDYYYDMKFCFAEIKCHVFYGSKVVMDNFSFEFPQSKYSDWNEEKFIRYINAVTGLNFVALEEMKRLVWCLAFLSERKEKSNTNTGEQEFLKREFNNFMELSTTGEKHIDKKVEIIKEYLPKLGLKEGEVNMDNLTLEEKNNLRNILIKYVEILDRSNKNNNDGFKFVQYIKNLLVINKKLNS